MMVIIYGKLMFVGNVKICCYEWCRKLVMECDIICNIIDLIFGCDVFDVFYEVKVKRIDCVIKVILFVGMC